MSAPTAGPESVPLGVSPARSVPLFRTTAVAAAWGESFYGDEIDGDGMAFRWMQSAARLDFEPAASPRFLELWTYSNFHDLSQQLSLVSGDATRVSVLVRGWQRVSVAVPPGVRSVRLAANRPYPPELHPGDGRDLALQIRHPFVHGDPRRHADITAQHENAQLNVREVLEGKATLTSRPRMVGIDLIGTCNVKPPCVYCAWDSSKALEGDEVDTPFELAALGDFFHRASHLVNCSIGEPFLMRNLPELLDVFDARGKTLEMATNGQILTDAQLESLIGRNVDIYVSLDAATPETYARLRNDRFERILPNLRRLVAAKGGRGPEHAPLVDLVFMPMRANRHEAEAFAELCAELGIDRLVLRPLNVSVADELVGDRAGYHYDYAKELLPLEEQVRLAGRLAERCRQLGVRFANQLDFGGRLEGRLADVFEEGRREVASAASVTTAPPAPTALEPPPPADPVPAPLPSLGAEKLPLCAEPWQSLYVLRRGILPCCYGSVPIAPAGRAEEAWNGPKLQAIRGELAAGRFPQYCLDSPDCPIVKKHAVAHPPAAHEPPRPSFVHRALRRLHVLG